MANKLLILVVVLSLAFLHAQIGLADTTSTLRPIADGTDDSASWTNTAGTTCNGADCSLEVDESSGASCTNSDGDTSFIEGSTNGASQTFDIDESSIPNDATITQIDVTVCEKRVGSAPPNKFQTRRCIDGTCANSGIDVGAAGNYAEVTQSHSGLNITKTSSTDLEIGVSIMDTNNKVVRISQISTVITYTLPATPTSTPTPTPTPTQEPATVEPSGTKGGNYPAEIIFSGEIYPGAKIQINLLSDFFGKVIEKGDEYTVGGTGTFALETKGNSIGEQFYGLSVKDRDGNPATAKFYTYDLKFNTTVKQENIILAPMASISRKTLAKSESFTVSGYGTPDNKIEVLSDLKVIGIGTADKDGSYAVTIDGGKLFLGPHKIQARQVDDATGKAGDLSEFYTITVGQFSYASVDMNKDDKINIADWSIFLYNWSAPDEKTKIKDDLNSDGIVDVTDFSIFLTSFQNHL